MTPEANPAWMKPFFTPSTKSRSLPSVPAPKTCTSMRPLLFALTSFAKASAMTALRDMFMSTESPCASFRTIFFSCAKAPAENRNADRTIVETNFIDCFMR